MSINNHSQVRNKEDKEKNIGEQSHGRLKKTLATFEYASKKPQGQSERTGVLFNGLKSSQIDLNNLLKKAGYRINGGGIVNGSSYKEASTHGEKGSPKGNILLVNKIPGPSPAMPMFGPKASSPKGAISLKNVFVPSTKDYSKLKSGKSPKRKAENSNGKKSQAQLQPNVSTNSGSKPLQTNLAKLLFGNTHLSKILKQPQANHLMIKGEKKNKNGSSSQLKDGKPDKEAQIYTSRSKKVQK